MEDIDIDIEDSVVNSGCNKYIWTKPKTIELIEMLQGMPALWNVSAKEYRNRNIKYDDLSPWNVPFFKNSLCQYRLFRFCEPAAIIIKAAQTPPASIYSFSTPNSVSVSVVYDQTGVDAQHRGQHVSRYN